MITYIFSGFDPNERFNNEVSNFFKRDMEKCKSIVFIPGNFDDMDKVNKFALIDVQWFDEIGIKLENVDILDENMKKDIMNFKIANADIIFIMGGDTIKQNLFLEKYELKNAIRKSMGIVIGISAGAINLGIDSLCSKDIDDGVEKTILYKGIGRIPYTIEPHFNISNSKFIRDELYSISDKLKIYGLPNDTGVRIENNNYDIIKGKFYLINNCYIENL